MRVRYVGSTWEERAGLVGTIVPTLRNEYPWAGLGKDEVVVKLDGSDPCRAPWDGRKRDWDFVCARADLVEVH